MEQALEWFLRLKDHHDESDRQAFELWQNEDPQHAQAYRRVADMWSSPEFTEAVLQQENRPVAPVGWRSSPRSVRYAAIAASVLLILGWINAEAIRIAVQSDHRTGTGQRERVVLSDGSTALLNSGSAVDVRFTPTLRHVELLKGETYVEVTKDPKREFELVGGTVTAWVVGTAFSMRRESGDSIVTVRSGEVAVRGSRGEQRELRLHAGDQVRVTEHGVGSVQHVRSDEAFAWVEGRMRFHDQPLGDVVAELERHHHGVILIMNSTLKTAHVSGNYRLDDPLAVVISLADAIHARVTRISDYLIILQ